MADLRIDRGETVAVIGPSGSGKTTLLNLIAGIALPRAGRVRTNGVEFAVLDDPARREFRIANIGLVFPVALPQGAVLAHRLEMTREILSVAQV